MRNIDSFVTKTYPLRSWMEKTYKNATKKVSKSTNSVYYYINRNNGQAEPIRIRISDHISKVHYLSIIINSDLLNKNKITYIVMLPTNNKVPMLVSSLSELKTVISYYIFSELHKNIVPETVSDNVISTKKSNNTEESSEITEKSEEDYIVYAKQYGISLDIFNNFTKGQIKTLNSLPNATMPVTYCADDVDRPLPNPNTINKLKTILTSKKRATSTQNWQRVSLFVPHIFDYDKQTKQLVKKVFENTVPFETLVNMIKTSSNKSKFEFFCDCYQAINTNNG